MPEFHGRFDSIRRRYCRRLHNASPQVRDHHDHCQVNDSTEYSVGVKKKKKRSRAFTAVRLQQLADLSGRTPTCTEQCSGTEYGVQTDYICRIRSSRFILQAKQGKARLD